MTKNFYLSDAFEFDHTAKEESAAEAKSYAVYSVTAMINGWCGSDGNPFPVRDFVDGPNDPIVPGWAGPCFDEIETLEGMGFLG